MGFQYPVIIAGGKNRIGPGSDANGREPHLLVVIST